MCLPSPKVITPPPPPTPRWLQDTSGEMIKSKYPLSDRNKKKNQTLLNSRKQKPTVATATSNDNGNGGGGGGGTPFNQGTTLQNSDLMKNDAGLNYFGTV